MDKAINRELYDTWMKWNAGKRDFGTVYCEYRMRNIGGYCNGCPYKTPGKAQSCTMYATCADHKKENKREFKRIVANYLPNKLELI